MINDHDDFQVFVSYRVIPGTATPTFDYNVAEEGTLRFGAGVHNATINASRNVTYIQIYIVIVYNTFNHSGM